MLDADSWYPITIRPESNKKHTIKEHTMAHVLVAHADHGVREVMAQALHEEAGHDVVSTVDATSTLSALWLSPRPVVALIAERLYPASGLSILDVAAHDGRSGPLSRHRYIVMSTLPQNIRLDKRRLLSRLGARVLSQPFDLDVLLQMVDDAATSLAGRRYLVPRPSWADAARAVSLYACLAPGIHAFR